MKNGRSPTATRYHPTNMNPSTNLLLIIPAIFFTACASDKRAEREPARGERESTRAEEHRKSSADDQEEGSKPPRIGMTKDEVMNRYGEPTNVSTSSHGETWAYVFNNLSGRSFIPIYGNIYEATKRRHSGTVIFDDNGRVKDFHWNESNPKGATIWR